MARTLSSPQVLRTGANAPSFQLRGTDGKLHSLADYKGKATLIVFICNHCPFVKARIGDLIALQSKFERSELEIVGINSNDPSYQDEGFDNMIKFSKEYGLNFDYLIDETQNIARAYGAVCTPDPFLFVNGKLAFHGRINDAMEPDAIPNVAIMENNVSLLLAGKNLEKDFDPSIGCSIKWKDSD